MGHVKGAKFVGHHSAFGCPYSQHNLSRDTQLLDRLGPVRTDTTVDSGPPPKKVKDEPLDDVGALSPDRGYER